MDTDKGHVERVGTITEGLPRKAQEGETMIKTNRNSEIVLIAIGSPFHHNKMSPVKKSEFDILQCEAVGDEYLLLEITKRADGGKNDDL